MCFIIYHMSCNMSFVSSWEKCVAVGKSITQCLLCVYNNIIYSLYYILYVIPATSLLHTIMTVLIVLSLYASTIII